MKDYTFSFRARAPKDAEQVQIWAGFRTFEAREDGFFYLNGRRYWLRGGNHIPFALRPNDRDLAD